MTTFFNHAEGFHRQKVDNTFCVCV